ncbi:MAG: peptidylprolyl isomerase [Bacteroidetes bacterium]|nr:peptidylprolyl isomerase [Bacteroidota bacterium]
MKHLVTVFLLVSSLQWAQAQQQTIAQMKANIEKADNPIAYVRDVLKKKYKLDTIIVMNTVHFSSKADSLAYNGKVKKVYGPIEKKYLVQVLAKLPNSFTRVSQIFIDTSIFTRRVADSLAKSIVERVNTGTATFEDMAQTYSMGGEGLTKGDLGWIARGAMQPDIEKEIARHKKGEAFKVWSNNGVHVIKKTADPKEDTGFALLLRVWL